MSALSPRFSDALVYAAALHRDQCRKVSGAPYVAHLLRVAGMVLEYGAGEDEAIAALLHDALEDQGGAAVGEEIGRRFGADVAAMVEGCSDTVTTPKPPWRPRKEAHLAHLLHASESVRRIVAADKLDNVRALTQEYRLRGEAVWDFFHGGRAGTLWYYEAMTDTLAAAGVTPLVEELQRAVAELQQLAGA
jgi:GTP pyrophosphokinase